MQDSIYYHKPGHFREFIRVITDKSISISEALATFREVKCLPNKFKHMTVHELSKSPVLIQELYETLRKRMQPESKYKLPYNKAEREKQLIDNIAENYAIDKEKAQAKVITGHQNDGTREFNYALEVVIAPRTDLDEKHAGEVEFIGSINSTPSIDGGKDIFKVIRTGGWIKKVIPEMLQVLTIFYTSVALTQVHITQQRKDFLASLQ